MTVLNDTAGKLGYAKPLGTVDAAPKTDLGTEAFFSIQAPGGTDFKSGFDLMRDLLKDSPAPAFDRYLVVVDYSDEPGIDDHGGK
jgi:hypothetical protein